MSNYPVWWETTVTIYNKYTDPQTDVVKWYRHMVSGCFWKNISDKVKVGETTLETNNIICRIPEQSDFMEKYAWVQLPNDEMSGYFTLGPGDIIIKGGVSDVVNEYLSGHRSTDIIAKYKELQGCLEVQEIDIATGTGRNNPHYYVRGI